VCTAISALASTWAAQHIAHTRHKPNKALLVYLCCCWQPLPHHHGAVTHSHHVRNTNHTQEWVHSQLAALQNNKSHKESHKDTDIAIQPRGPQKGTIGINHRENTYDDQDCSMSSTGTSIGWVAMQDCSSQHIGSRLTAGRSGLLNLACPAVPFTKSRTSGRAALPEREQPNQHNRQHGNIMHATLSPLC
jgi:hypothetical protein